MQFMKPDASFGHGEINQDKMLLNMLVQHCVVVKIYKYVAAELLKGPGETCRRDDKRQEECYTERWRDFHRRATQVKTLLRESKEMALTCLSPNRQVFVLLDIQHDLQAVTSATF